MDADNPFESTSPSKVNISLTDDPLAGLDDLMSSTLNLIGAPPPGNPLDGTSSAGGAPAAAGASSSNPYEGLENLGLDLSVLGSAASGGGAAPGADAFGAIDLSSMASGLNAPGLADIDLLGVPSPAGSAPASASKPTEAASAASASGLGLGPLGAGGSNSINQAFSLDMEEDIPLHNTSVLGGPKAAAAPVAASNTPAPVSSAAAAAPAVADPLASSPLQAAPPSGSSVGLGDSDMNPFDFGRSSTAQAASSMMAPATAPRSELTAEHSGLQSHISGGVEAAGPSGLSFGGGSLASAGGAPSQAGDEAGAEEHPVKVWVRDPDKAEGTNKLGMRTTYYTYRIRTEATLPSLRAEGTEVRRRFSEFDVSDVMPSCC